MTFLVHKETFALNLSLLEVPPVSVDVLKIAASEGAIASAQVFRIRFGLLTWFGRVDVS